MRIGLLGDVHGQRAWLMRALDIFAGTDVDTIIQLGDLGIWPGGEAQQTFDLANRRLDRAGMTMLVAPGNHEDYDQVNALPPRDDGWLPYRDRILLAPRGLRTSIGGQSVLWLGGAGSIDRQWRLSEEAMYAREKKKYGSSKRLKLWWEDEYITDTDVDRSVAGGGADLMVCHDAPWPVEGVDLTRHRGAEDDLRMARESSARLTRVVDAVKPRMLLHGHHHVRVEVRHMTPGGHLTQTRGLSCDGDEDAMAMLDLPEMKVKYRTDGW